jgi:transcriptional regulator GlxA family with amidase domain
LCNINDQHELSHFFYKIKVQELLYLLFSKLLKRENEPAVNINKADIEKIFAVRNLMLADLSAPPQLSALAKTNNLSETKMKHLFKQIFGDSIYNYYQKARMEEAAFLLKQASFSVSDVGYELGFSNLSHFSRLFQRHYGITPKKYTVAG